ncbi:hypothetical protein K6V92_05570 [Cupriavidus respiraculi]|uniref:hypothetical protein n=1 Tax=Cupriavidus respiraculi TaxID=195930 RepID=UPI001C93E533|nr:hypothetical protein [Cupriavidus respiraculi]MBY4946088.1 hypothetical protein [Cupriavidus respiraculi]
MNVSLVNRAMAAAPETSVVRANPLPRPGAQDARAPDRGESSIGADAPGRSTRPSGNIEIAAGEDSKQESPIIKALKAQIETLQAQLESQMRQLQAVEVQSPGDMASMGTVAVLRAGVTQTSVQLQQAIAKLAEVMMAMSGADRKNLVSTTA